MSEKLNFDDLNSYVDKIEKKLQDFENIFKSVHDEIFVCDNNGIVIFVNNACERLYNMPADKLIGRKVKELETNGVFYPSISDIVLKTHKPETIVQTTNLGKKVLVSANPIFNKNKELCMVVSNSRDITELINLKKELENKELLLQQYSNQIKQLTKQSMEEELFYCSHKMEKIHHLINKVAPGDINILLLGESGVGKTMIASLIHRLSCYKNGPFQVINCSAIPESLLESELFGYEKGAFTGATSKGKRGLFELAEGGTLFLDEIGEIPLQLQVKLLQVIQEKKFRKIGCVDEIKVNCRLITASNQNLLVKCQERQFREDLYYRINGISISIPPLRDRKEDIPVLIRHFLDLCNKTSGKTKRISQDVLDLFHNYSWPGNIRELKNNIEQLYLVSDEDIITVEDIPEYLFSSFAIPTHSSQTAHKRIIPMKTAVAILEEELFKTAYIKYKSSYKVAEVLGVSQSTAIRKLRKYLSTAEIN